MRITENTENPDMEPEDKPDKVPNDSSLDRSRLNQEAEKLIKRSVGRPKKEEREREIRESFRTQKKDIQKPTEPPKLTPEEAELLRKRCLSPSSIAAVAQIYKFSEISLIALDFKLEKLPMKYLPPKDKILTDLEAETYAADLIEFLLEEIGVAATSSGLKYVRLLGQPLYVAFRTRKEALERMMLDNVGKAIIAEKEKNGQA